MTKLTVVVPDNKIIKDGKHLEMMVNAPENVRAIQWDGLNGHIEYNDGSANEKITQKSDVQAYIDAFDNEITRLARKPAVKPWEEASWDNDTQTWVVNLVSDSVRVRQEAMLEYVENERDWALNEGVVDANGVQWSANGEAIQRISRIINRINAYRNGDVSSAFPNGKTTIILLDLNNQPHTLTVQDILNLGVLGDDLWDRVDDNTYYLKDQILTSTTHDELDSIDTSQGWS